MKDTKEYKNLEKIAKKIVKQNHPFEQVFATKEQALDLFEYNRFKQEIIESKV